MWLVLDLETTGLDPKNDKILELAAIIVDPGTLEERGSFESVTRQENLDLSSMHEAVQKMHTNNGLFDACEFGGLTINELDEAVVNFVAGAEPRSVVLIGNSIHFDRSFLVQHMPFLARRLSHRMIDVSSFHTVMAKWNAKLCARRSTTAHRAMSDCRESLEALRAYREIFIGRGGDV